MAKSIQERFRSKEAAIRRAIELRKAGGEVVHVILSNGEFFVENYDCIIRDWETEVDVQRRKA